MSTPVRFSRIMGALKSSAAYKKSDTPNPLEFNAPLTNSLIPLTGQDYTFSRASTATFIDSEGVLQTAGIDEARFSGSKRVENLVSYSEDFSNALWITVKNGAATVTKTPNYDIAPDGTQTATRIECALNGGAFAYIRQTPPGAVDSDITTRSYWAKSNTSNSQVITMTHTNGQTITVTTDWQRFEEVVPSGILAARNEVDIGIRGANTDITCDVLVWRPQLEIIPTALTLASVYVSTDVLPAPYHGANVDGVKYFDSANSKGILLEGESTNLLTYSEDFTNVKWLTFNATKTGTTTIDGIDCMEVSFDTGATAALYQSSIGLSSLNRYTMRARVRSKTGVINLRLSLGAQSTEFSPNISVGEEWQDIVYSNPVDILDTSSISIRNHSSGIPQSFYVAWVQIEESPHATSYIPTGAATVTRLADVLSYDYQPPALLGSMAMVVKNLPNVTTPAGTRLLSSAEASRFIYKATAAIYRSHDGTNVSEYTNLGANITFGLAWNSADLVYVYTSGTLTTTAALDTDGFNSEGKSLGVGSAGTNGTLQQQGNYSSLQFYNTALPQTQMELLTND